MAEEEDNSEPKKNVSRRGFLKTAAAGAAAAGVAVTAPPLLTGNPGLWSGVFGGVAQSPESDPIVAYIGDARNGEIVLMAGNREVRVRDFGIVSWLARALSGA